MWGLAGLPSHSQLVPELDDKAGNRPKWSGSVSGLCFTGLNSLKLLSTDLDLLCICRPIWDANRIQMDYRCPVFGPLIQPILDLTSTHLNQPIWILIQSTWLSPLKIGSRHNLIKPNFPNMLGPDLIQDPLKFLHSLLHQEVIINYVLYIENKCWKYTRLTQPHSTVESCSLLVRVM